VTVVPLIALTKRDNRQGIFLVDTQNMKAHFIPVTLGIVNAGLAEVVEPPLSGTVVTLGHHLLEDGASIILPGEKSGGTPQELVNPADRKESGRRQSGEKR